ncbi:MAG: helix-turn-helix transcriptional regulator [Provencibacterium sp.]|jgi:transcriptional regulator with XRE-family HTH domain|nr:helix-turn-helix transcriptional regulator [Provencibacterium sp.]
MINRKYHESICHEFPRRLQMLRKRENKSQVVLSQLCGLTDTAITRYEGGKNKPTVDSLLAIADYFHVSTDFLLGRTNY